MHSLLDIKKAWELLPTIVLRVWTPCTTMIKQQPHAYRYRHGAFCCYHPVVLEIVQISEQDNILKRFVSLICNAIVSTIDDVIL